MAIVFVALGVLVAVIQLAEVRRIRREAAAFDALMRRYRAALGLEPRR